MVTMIYLVDVVKKLNKTKKKSISIKLMHENQSKIQLKRIIFNTLRNIYVSF